MLPPADRQPAYVLHRRAFRETSVIVELLTRDHGRVGGVVRGAKGPRRVHHIEPFSQLAATWRGRGQLINVLRTEPLAPRRLAGDALFAGLYLNELLMRTLSHQEPVAALFQHYGEALAELASGGDVEPALRTFERQLLQELGYGLAFDVDLDSGRPIDHAKEYLVVTGEGFREAANGDAAAVLQSPAQSALRLTGAQIAAVRADDYREADVRLAAKRVFRHALEMRLGGRSLATRKLFTGRGIARRDGHSADAVQGRA